MAVEMRIRNGSLALGAEAGRMDAIGANQNSA